MLLLWPPTYRLWPASILSTCGSSPSLQQEIACQLSRRIQPSPFFHIKPIPHSLIICHLFNPLSYSHTSVSQSTLKLHSAVPFCNLVFFVNSKQKPFVCSAFRSRGCRPTSSELQGSPTHYSAPGWSLVAQVLLDLVHTVISWGAL